MKYIEINERPEHTPWADNQIHGMMPLPDGMVGITFDCSPPVDYHISIMRLSFPRSQLPKVVDIIAKFLRDNGIDVQQDGMSGMP
jgi:hypothetical protein